MLQHTSENSVSFLASSIKSSKSVAANTVLSAGKADLLAESSEKSSEKLLAFSAFLEGSMNQGLLENLSPDAINAIDPGKSQLLHVPLENATQLESLVLPESVLNEAGGGVFKEVKPALPPLVLGESVEADEVLSAQLSVSELVQPQGDLAGSHALQSSDAMAERLPGSAEQQVSINSKSVKSIETFEQKIPLSQVGELPEVDQVQSVAELTVMSGDISKALGQKVFDQKAPMQSPVQTGLSKPQVSSQAVVSGQALLDSESAEADSLLLKSVGGSVSAQQAHATLSSQQSMPSSMAAEMAKNQAFMEQFRQQQTALKQQKSLQLEENKSLSMEGGVTSLHREGGNHLPNSLERLSAAPTSYQSIAHGIHSPKWGEALGKHLMMAVNRDIQKMQITLNPEKLGPIQVRLHMDKDRQLHVSLLANHTLTREAMMDAIPRLREMLESNGTQLANLDVADHGFEQETFAEDSEQQDSSKSGGTLEVSEEVESSQTLSQVRLNRISDTMVDYYA